MRINSTKVLSTALLYGVGVLGAVFLLELIWFSLASGDAPVEHAGLAPAGSSSGLLIRTIGAEQSFQDIIDRPLFSWTRQPEQESTATPEISSSDVDARWELSGIVEVGAKKYAYFKEVDGDERLRIEEDMYFEKWKVQSIGPEQVVLSGGGSRRGDSSHNVEEKIFRLKVNTAPVKPKDSRLARVKQQAAKRKQAQKQKRAKRSDKGQAPKMPRVP